MNIILKTIFEGVYDKESILNCLQGTPHIVKEIWLLLKHEYYRAHIKHSDHCNIYKRREEVYVDHDLVMPEFQFLIRFQDYEVGDMYRESRTIFPEPKNININMMPYIYGGHNFKDYKLPDILKPYFPLIRFCRTGKHMYDMSSDKGKIFYLTIQEGWVEPNQSQRRPGIHTDNPGPIKIKDGDMFLTSDEGQGNYMLRLFEHSWGNGMILESRRHIGGIYLASNVPKSCRAWDCKIEQDAKSGVDIIGQHGSCEHIRDFLPNDKEVVLEADCMYWLTDRTPHESLPVKERTYRQFFRVVTEQVSFWFADHSTANPCGVLPDPSITKIVRGNKFDTDTLEVVPPPHTLKTKMKSLCSRFKGFARSSKTTNFLKF